MAERHLGVTDFMAEILRTVKFSFIVGLERSDRGIYDVADTELDTIFAWVRETIRQYLLLEETLVAETVLELDGKEVRGRKPSEAEAEKLREWILGRIWM
jgi:hypothetical protein